MDSFIEATLLIEGALEETKLFNSEDELVTWITDLTLEHKTVNAETQWVVYTIHHGHSNDQECECVQYLLSHKPNFIIG